MQDAASTANRPSILKQQHSFTYSAGQEYEARLCKTLLPRISKSDVEGCADLFHPSNNCVIKVVEHRRRCSEAQLEAVVARVVETEKEVGRCGGGGAVARGLA